MGKGKNYSLTLKEGDTVLYSKFGLGVTDVELQGQEYAILFERDCIGIMPSSNSTVEDIKDIKPLGDRVLIQVDSAAEESAGRETQPLYSPPPPPLRLLLLFGERVY